jgi:hypothetical protein
MIELFEGRLGGGKTYNAVVRMVAQLARGGTVCTNVQIIWPAIVEYVAKRWGVVLERDQCIELQDEQIFLFHRYIPKGDKDLPVLVVVDEAHLHFNARDHAQTDRKFRETLTFLTQSRKVNVDVIFISQSILNMDRQFGRLVQYIWRFRDLSKWKIPGLGLSYPFQQILCVQYDYDGRTMLNRAFQQKDTRIFSLYNTDAIVRPFITLENVVTKRSLAKVEKRKLTKMAKIFIPLGIIGGLICGYLLYSNFSNNIGKDPNAKTASSVNTTAAPQSAATAKIATSDQTDEERKRSKQAYDIYAETFKAWNGINKSLQTAENGWYQVGEMSTRGYVTAISERRVQVAQPDGRTGWVVANKDFVPPPPPSPTATPQVIEKPIIVSADVTGLNAIATPTPTPTPSGTSFPITISR